MYLCMYVCMYVLCMYVWRSETINKNINHFFNTPTKCTLYTCYTYFLPNLSYMFQCFIHHPQRELCILAQNCKLCTRLLHKMCYKVQNLPFFFTFFKKPERPRNER